MSTLLRTWRLANGLKIEIFDDTVGYYGDYSSVKLVIRCKVGVKKEYLCSFESHPRYSQVVEVLGSEAEYLREITKPGVPGKSLAGVKAFLVDKFEENALGYMEHAKFPERFIQKKFEDTAKQLSKEDHLADGDR